MIEGKDNVNSVPEEGAKESGQARKGCCVLMLMGLVFFSGFVSCGLYFLSSMEYSFLQNALSANAKVTGVQIVQKNGKEASSLPVANGGSTHNLTTIEIMFKDSNDTVIKTKLSEGETTLLREGDLIEVFYNPDSPKDVRSSKSKDNAELMQRLSKVFAVIFICLLGLAVFRFKMKQKEQFCEINHHLN